MQFCEKSQKTLDKFMTILYYITVLYKRGVLLYQDFSGFSPEELVEKAKVGDENATAELIVRFSPMVNSIACDLSERFEVEDLAQEGMFGLLSAIYGYDNSKGAKFSTFASVCVRNRIMNAIKSLSRQNSFTVDVLSDVIPDFSSDPQDIWSNREQSNNLADEFREKLSDFELEVLKLYLGGFSYNSISQKLGCTAKSIDNALQRIRRKLR